MLAPRDRTREECGRGPLSARLDRVEPGVPLVRTLGRFATVSPNSKGPQPMITAIVQYRLPPSIDLKACAAHFRKIAPGFRGVPGLIRKQFIYAEDGWAGGVLSLGEPRRRRRVLHRPLDRGHPRALRHGSADQVFPHRLRHR